MKFFVLLHTAERPKRSFSCFCTLQKDQKEVFHASERFRKAKKKIFMLLHTAERPKRRFSRFCTLQKGQKEVFYASAHCRKTKKSFSCFCTLQKDQKEDFHATYNICNTKKRFLALKRRAEAWNSGFNFYMTIMLTGQQSAGGGPRLFLFFYPNF